jgi:integrase
MGIKTKAIKDKELEISIYQYCKKYDIQLYIMILLIRYTGYRINDLRCLRKRDVSGKYLEIVENKTKYLEQKYKEKAEKDGTSPKPPKKARKILIHPTLKKILDEYTKDMEMWHVLFPSPRGRNKPLSYSQFDRRLDKVTKEFHLKDFGFHSFRKMCFLAVYEDNGNSIEKAQHYAGHTSSLSTSIYLDLDQETNDKITLEMKDPLRGLIGS